VLVNHLPCFFICCSCYSTLETKCSIPEFSDSPGQFPFSSLVARAVLECSGQLCPSPQPLRPQPIPQGHSSHLQDIFPSPLNWTCLPQHDSNAELLLWGVEGALILHENALQTVKCSADVSGQHSLTFYFFFFCYMFILSILLIPLISQRALRKDKSFMSQAGRVVHAYNASSWVTKAARNWVRGQHGLDSNALSQKQNKMKQNQQQ
jgi:hypothetical protein